MRRFKAGTATARIPHHSRPRSRNSAFAHGVDRAGLVMDPFLGLGSSAIAAARQGVDFIGIEMDEHYLREAVKRVKAAFSAGA